MTHQSSVIEWEGIRNFSSISSSIVDRRFPLHDQWWSCEEELGVTISLFLLGSLLMWWAFRMIRRRLTEHFYDMHLRMYNVHMSVCILKIKLFSMFFVLLGITNSKLCNVILCQQDVFTPRSKTDWFLYASTKKEGFT